MNWTVVFKTNKTTLNRNAQSKPGDAVTTAQQTGGLRQLNFHSRIRRMSYGYVPAPIPPPPMSQPSWFSRNKKWLIPTVIVVPILLMALFVVGILALVFGMMKSSEPYKHGVAVAQADARVIAQLGVPVTPGWYAGGNINLSGSSGSADLSIPLNGSLRHGTVYVVARKSAGIWRYQTLEVEIEGAPERINLLPAQPQYEEQR